MSPEPSTNAPLTLRPKGWVASVGIKGIAFCQKNIRIVIRVSNVKYLR